MPRAVFATVATRYAATEMGQLRPASEFRSPIRSRVKFTPAFSELPGFVLRSRSPRIKKPPRTKITPARSGRLFLDFRFRSGA